MSKPTISSISGLQRVVSLVPRSTFWRRPLERLRAETLRFGVV